MNLSGLSKDKKELVLGIKNLPKVFEDAANAPVLYVELNAGMQSGESETAQRNPTTSYVGRKADTNIAYLDVQSNIRTAHLFVDGREVQSATSGTWRAIGRQPGMHSVRVSADGYDDFTKQVKFLKDKPIRLPVELHARAATNEVRIDPYSRSNMDQPLAVDSIVETPAARSRAGVVTITSDPSGATVLINAVLAGVTPIALQITPVGLDFTVTLTKHGYMERKVKTSSKTNPSSLHVDLKKVPN